MYSRIIKLAKGVNEVKRPDSKIFNRVTAIVCAVAMLLSLGGCSFRFGRLEELIRPPKAPSEYQGLQSEFENTIGADSELITPENGDYRSAFITYDFNTDGNEDAIVIYRRKNSNEVEFSYFKNDGNKWTFFSTAKGLGNSVDRVIFADLDNNSVSEIIIGWNLFSSKTNKFFSIYELTDEGIKAYDSYPYTYINVMDVNGDSYTDIFALSVDNPSVTDTVVPNGFARVYGISAGSSEPTLLSETLVDGSVTSYNSVVTEKADDKTLIYVEANKSDREMITEILYWDDETNSLVAPLFDTNSRSTVSTWRNQQIVSFDVDSDGMLEIPTGVEMEGSSLSLSSDFAENNIVASAIDSKLCYIRWVKFRDGKLKPVQYSVVNDKFSYMLNIPSSWVGRITVASNDGQWDFYRRNNLQGQRGDLLFSIYAYSKSDSAERDKYSDFELLGESDSNIFVYKLTESGKKFGIKDETLKSGFVTAEYGGKK